jgi:hypothetical protein
MIAIIWNNQPKYAVPNRELWQQFFETSSTEEQEYLLLLILENAEDNNERLDVVSNSNMTSTKEEALFAMLPYVSTLTELEKMATHTTEDMLEVRERMVAMSLATHRTKLRLARNNPQRWRVYYDMPIEILRNEALSEILTHSTSNGERWWVFLNTKDATLKARALKEMMTIRKTKRT